MPRDSDAWAAPYFKPAIKLLIACLNTIFQDLKILTQGASVTTTTLNFMSASRCHDQLYGACSEGVAGHFGGEVLKAIKSMSPSLDIKILAILNNVSPAWLS